MKKTTLFLLIFFPLQKSIAQYIKIDNGILSTAYIDPIGLGILDGKTTNYTVNLGVDYFEKSFFYLSSKVGYIQIGGKEDLNAWGTKVNELKHYLHMNTTLRTYVRKDAATCFVGVGPYYNVLLSNDRFNSVDYKDGYKVKSYLGALGEAGFHFDVKRLRLGLSVQYMYSLSPTASSSEIDMKNNNLGALTTIGYQI